MKKTIEPELVSTRTYRLKNGATGVLEKYKDCSIKFNWFFPNGTIVSPMMTFADQGFTFVFQTHDVHNDIYISGIIPQGKKRYCGRAENVIRFAFQIDHGRYSIKENTPSMRPEPMKTVLTRHPSKHRTKHGAKTEIYKVVSGGSMK